MSERLSRRAWLGCLIPFTLLTPLGGCPTQQTDDIGDVLKHRLDEIQLEANVLRDVAIAVR